MKNIFNRRQFLQAGAAAAASLALPKDVFAAGMKSVLIFTKSSGFEHDVVKTSGGKPSILETAVTTLGKKHGFDVTATKDGGVFDSKDFHKYAAVLFFTTGDLTTVGTDKNPPMSSQGKQSLLDAIHAGLGFVGVHAASDTFHTPPLAHPSSDKSVKSSVAGSLSAESHTSNLPARSAQSGNQSHLCDTQLNSRLHAAARSHNTTHTASRSWTSGSCRAALAPTASKLPWKRDSPRSRPASNNGHRAPPAK